MRLGIHLKSLVCCVLLSSSLFASKLTGKVTNETTGKPSSGDEIVLLSLAGGMTETARTTSDAQGGFALDVTDEGVQHLIRANHQGVNYFQPVAPGTTTAAINVYDAAKKVAPLVGEGRVMRMQTSGGSLEVSEMYILRNESNPPRTWMGERTFEFTLPDGATIVQGMAAGPGGMPVTSSPVSAGKSNQYAFVFPIRPGRSQLQVTYQLPYNGSHDFTITPAMPLAELGVMLPKSMSFNSSGENFSPASDEAGLAVFVAKSISAGQALKFSISGQGSAPPNGKSGVAGGGSPNLSGASTGVQVAASDPANGLLWFVLSMAIIALGSGAYWMNRRRPVFDASGSLAGPAAAGPSQGRGRQPQEPRALQRSAASRPVMEAIKEEMFRLETDRVMGKISQQDYDAAKAGLDTLLRRQMKNLSEGKNP